MQKFVVFLVAIFISGGVYSQFGKYHSIPNSGSGGFFIENPNGGFVYYSINSGEAPFIFSMTEEGMLEAISQINARATHDSDWYVHDVFPIEDGFWMFSNLRLPDQNNLRKVVASHYSWNYELINEFELPLESTALLTEFVFWRNEEIHFLFFDTSVMTNKKGVFQTGDGEWKVDSLKGNQGVLNPTILNSRDSYAYSPINNKVYSPLNPEYFNTEPFQFNLENDSLESWQNELNSNVVFDPSIDTYIFSQDRKGYDLVCISDFQLSPNEDPEVDKSDVGKSLLIHRYDQNLEKNSVVPIGDFEFLFTPNDFGHTISSPHELLGDELEFAWAGSQDKNYPGTSDPYPNGFMYKKVSAIDGSEIEKRFIGIEQVNGPDYVDFYFSHRIQGYFEHNGYLTMLVKTQVNVGAQEKGVLTIKIEDIPLQVGKEHSLEKTMLISPNPVEDYLHIQGGIQGEYNLTDVTGKTYQRGLINGKTELDVQELPRGLYVLQFVSDQGGSLSRRFVKN